MNQSSQVPPDFSRDWDQVKDGWWYRVVGKFEVHLCLDAELGWEISVRSGGLNVSRPVYRKELSVAIVVADRLFNHYQEKALEPMEAES
ncbi:hypothetical protein [Ottowia sp.]|uniref:hypothetical protein n=1 Tax=Ottowia sp. TaxID=1898956 RepID=UPI0025EA2BD4|nr:hypothetical protein [Ottowia sp.]MBK6616564.1 hypothetical protein [Ottowia sp.]